MTIGYHPPPKNNDFRVCYNQRLDKWEDELSYIFEWFAVGLSDGTMIEKILPIAACCRSMIRRKAWENV